MTNEERQNIRKVIRNLFFKGQSLGPIKPNSQKVGINGIVQTAEVDQIPATIAKAVMNGFAPVLEVTLMRTDIDFVAGVVLSGMTGYRAGTNGPSYGLGVPEIDMDLLAGELLSIPAKNAPGVRTDSIRMGLAYPDPSTIELLMGKSNFQEITLKFNVLPDLEADIYFQMMEIGNIDAEGLDPLAVFIQTNTPFHRGAKSLLAMSLSVSSQQQIQVYRIDGAASGVVADIVADINSTDTTILTENASQNNPYIVGQVLRLGGVGGELALLTAVTPTSLTEHTLTVVRGAYGSTAASHLAGVEVEILKNVYRVNCTQQADITSSVPARIKAGNVAGALDLNLKGLLSDGGTAGASNIVATVGTGPVSSPTLVVTRT